MLTGDAMEFTEDGFTLVELLIAMVIAGVLTALAIPQMTVVRERSYVATMKSDLRNLGTAQEAYFVDNQAYAPSVGALTVGYKPSPNVSAAVDSASGSGWGATATHALTARTCTIAVSDKNGRGAPICP